MDIQESTLRDYSVLQPTNSLLVSTPDSSPHQASTPFIIHIEQKMGAPATEPRFNREFCGEDYAQCLLNRDQ